jgi:hypothetical protein
MNEAMSKLAEAAALDAEAETVQMLAHEDYEAGFSTRATIRAKRATALGRRAEMLREMAGRLMEVRA